MACQGSKRHTKDNINIHHAQYGASGLPWPIEARPGRVHAFLPPWTIQSLLVNETELGLGYDIPILYVHYGNNHTYSRFNNPSRRCSRFFAVLYIPRLSYPTASFHSPARLISTLNAYCIAIYQIRSFRNDIHQATVPPMQYHKVMQKHG